MILVDSPNADLEVVACSFCGASGVELTLGEDLRLERDCDINVGRVREGDSDWLWECDIDWPQEGDFNRLLEHDPDRLRERDPDRLRERDCNRLREGDSNRLPVCSVALSALCRSFIWVGLLHRGRNFEEQYLLKYLLLSRRP